MINENERKRNSAIRQGGVYSKDTQQRINLNPINVHSQSKLNNQKQDDQLPKGLSKLDRFLSSQYTLNGKFKSKQTNNLPSNNYNFIRPASTIQMKKNDSFKLPSDQTTIIAKDSIQSSYLRSNSKENYINEENYNMFNYQQPNITNLNSTADLDQDQLVKKIVQNELGLNNLGNTCYMNTCLQNLIHCEPFIKRLLSLNDKILQVGIGNISKNFYNLCLNIANSNTSVEPYAFKNAFGRAHIPFNGFNQHDTQEFCRILLDDISNELNISKKKPQYQKVQTKNKTKKEIYSEYNRCFLEKENSLIVDTFYGQTENIFVCTCGFESYSYQRFLDLPIIFSGNRNGSTGMKLMDLLDRFFKEEKIKWDTKCEKCKLLAVHSRKIKLVSLPEVLIISIQRTSTMIRAKYSSCINYPFQIDLSKYVDFDCYINQGTEYILTGISNHSGTLNCGHYFAYIKLENGWYTFNDSQVSPNNVGNTSNGVYCLFYQKAIKK